MAIRWIRTRLENGKLPPGICNRNSFGLIVDNLEEGVMSDNVGKPKPPAVWEGLAQIIAVLGGVAAVLALFGPVQNWPWSSRVFLSLSGATLAIVGLIGVLVSPRRSRSWLFSSVVLFASACSLIAGTWARPTAAHSLAMSPAPTQTPSASTPSTNQSDVLVYPSLKVSFDTRSDPVPFCSTYSGAGSIPAGFQLAIFDRVYADPSEYFSLDGVVRQDGQRWTIEDVSLGDNPATGKDESVGLKVELHAQLLDKATYESLSDVVEVDAQGHRVPNGYWKVHTLPGIAEAMLVVTRGPLKGGDSCG